MRCNDFIELCEPFEAQDYHERTVKFGALPRPTETWGFMEGEVQSEERR